MERTETGMSFFTATAMVTGTELGPCAATLVSPLPHPAIVSRRGTETRAAMLRNTSGLFLMAKIKVMESFACGFVERLAKHSVSLGRFQVAEVTVVRTKDQD